MPTTVKSSTTDKIRALHDRLTAEVEALVTGEDWARFLSVAARFHSYSANNVWLILAQRPDATRVAGYRTWQRLGRQVNRGAKICRVVHHSSPCSCQDDLRLGGASMAWTPKVTKSVADGEIRSLAVGHPLVDEYLAFLGARVRLNSWLAAAYDLKVFFCVVVKEPAEVRKADIFSFITDQRRPRHGAKVVRLEDGESGLAARTIKRRLASLSGFFTYLAAREDVDMVANPVPMGSGTRRPAGHPGKGGRALIRTPRTLPRVVGPTDVSSFLDALRTHRDRAMVSAMLLGGLRRCEVLGLRLADLNAGERRVFVAEGKGGNQRVVPVSARFFQAVGDYLLEERPLDASTQRVFVALKGPRRGRPLSPSGLDEVIGSARARAGIGRLTCHQLRHTCMTRLREAGMALEAVQAQAGHCSIESTRIYLHLGDRWVAEEYARAMAAIDHDLARPET